jgi:hypothetical protein
MEIIFLSYAEFGRWTPSERGESGGGCSAWHQHFDHLIDPPLADGVIDGFRHGLRLRPAQYEIDSRLSSLELAFRFHLDNDFFGSVEGNLKLSVRH